MATPLRIQQVHFDGATGQHDTRTLTPSEFNDIAASYMINDIPVTTRWINPPEGDGFTLVTVTVGIHQHIHYMYMIDQPVTGR